MKNSPECWAIIPAAGVGQRMASSIPKQYLQIKDKTILEYAAQPFLENARVKKIVFALHANDENFSNISFHDPQQKISTVIGGETRAHSVLNALRVMNKDIDENSFVLVHDAARPCLCAEDLENLIETCLPHEVGGILAARVTDTIKQVEDHAIISTIDRHYLWRAFTPQMFKFNILYQTINQALKNNFTVTDEASAVERAGYQPAIVESSVRNIKVTHADDITLAEAYLTLLHGL